MTRYALNLTRANAAAAVAAVNLLDGYPSRGLNVGDGRHVVVPSTWDGAGTVPPGWTTHATITKPGNGVYGLLLPQETQDRRMDPVRRARLSAAQQTLVDGLALVDTLPADWQGQSA